MGRIAMSKTNSTFAARLRELRVQKKLTQRELAERSGVPQYRISEYENGKRENPSLATIRQLASALGVKAGRLID